MENNTLRSYKNHNNSLSRNYNHNQNHQMALNGSASPGLLEKYPARSASSRSGSLRSGLPVVLGSNIFGIPG